jgi:hypothetical protein
VGAVSAVKEQVLDVLKGTSLGKKLATEAEEAAAARAARVAARAKYEAARAQQEKLPKLADAVHAAAEAYRVEIERRRVKLAEAQRAHNSVASSSAAALARGEGLLRRTASPLCHDAGPVFRAIEDAIQHVRGKHSLGCDEERMRRVSKLQPLSTAREAVEPIENAAAEVRAHDEALACIDTLRFGLAELRDLQLLVDVEPAAVREVVEGLPRACFCGRHDFTIEAALERALEPKEVR